ncbi:unnamed protein product [Blepharisma stoltei]|uniref:Starch synthase n=1 Tax=Blepharisma stoltei TaxID=1481888 RepID=A0AAU9ILD5_9CILI|nr:unnamed protein product [Blepharisma stoltei]
MSDTLVIEIRSQLLHLLCELASTPANAKEVIKSTLESIKAHVLSYSSITNSKILGLDSTQIAKIILKLHQILMEVSSEFHLLVSNNSYEAHALYKILEGINAGSLVKTESSFRVHVTDGVTSVMGTEIFINKELMLLAVSARGSFNPYINAIAAKLLEDVGFPIRPMQSLDELCHTAFRLFEDSGTHFLDKQKYEKYLDIFVWGKPGKIADALNELTTDLWFSVLKNNKESLSYIEQLLVGLLGHADSRSRDLAVMHLNAFYDDTDWQLLQPFNVKIRTIGKEFVIREMAELEDVDLKNIFMELHAPGFHNDSKNYVLSYHVPEIRETSSGVFLKVDLGTFTRCGFYDWRFSQVKDGTLQPIMSSFDKMNSDVNLNPIQGRFIVHPGDVKDLQIHEIFIDFQDAQFDTNTGKIIERGTFESVTNSLRERYSNGINCCYLMGALERDTGTDLQNPNASPLALTCRATACSLLGGAPEFKNLMSEAKDVGMRILVDCVARISSKNYHRRYKNKSLYTRNSEGLPVVCHGSEGRALKFEDSMMLNYRKSEVWNLLISDILTFAKNYKIDGIHMDNAQAWPQIMELDAGEMYRKDTDGQPHYTTQEIFDGLVVKRNENYAYWASLLRDKYPNPIFVKICKELWREFPEFYIIADCWKGDGMEERDKCIISSGPIPRLYDLPVKLAALFGKKLHKNGSFEETEKKDVSIMRTWHEDMLRKMPEGAIVVQSSTGHSLPYPALLYGRGAWAAVDVLFFMNYVPMSFIGEQDGHAYRSKIGSLYDFEESAPINIASRLSGSDLTELDIPSMRPSGIPRIESAASLSVIPDINELKRKEEKYQKELGPEFGFDLKKIKLHYIHRRGLRHEKDVLKYGELIPVVMRHEHGWHKQVLAFARCLPEEIAIIAINLNEHPVKGWLDLKSLTSYLEKDGGVVYSIGDWDNPETGDFYFKEELLMDQHYVSILPYRSVIKGIYQSEVPSDIALERSIERLKEKLSSGQPIDGNFSVINLIKLLDDGDPQHAYKEFANTIGNIYKNFLKVHNVSPLSFAKRISVLDEYKSGKILGYCDFLNSIQAPQCPPKEFAEILINENKIGPIVFTCPELGRFSTSGGLGIMVDELSQGLSQIGQEVWIISPYYDRNKKGHTNYLTGDPANINWQTNIDVSFGGETYTLGIHRGHENGVHLIFIHNPSLFPTIYSDGRHSWIMKQIVGWAKGVLEVLCWLKVIPAILVTNDWFTGLVPAYAKIGAFGRTFEGTTFVHVVHNLDASYEGRLYPTAQENSFISIHGLPKHFLVDPYWAREVVNPSRCAIMMSDQWATVSPSYRNELLANSPLKELLKQKYMPFATPNGIPVKPRLKKLEGKGTHLDAKKELQKKYFGFQDIDPSVCLFGFVGRITEQKGVHLIIDAAQQLIPQYNYKVQFLVGGPANYTEKYSAHNANRLKELKYRFPNNFFADPDNFFYDGPFVNLGSDFGLMPSMFEPGGIVQHEFFVAGTPVIAFKTGGLRDSISEWNPNNQSGSGFLFESYNLGDFLFAIHRAITCFHQQQNYPILRMRAAEAVIDGEQVSRNWCREFYRLKGKIYYECTVRRTIYEHLDGMPWTQDDFDISVPQNQVRQKSIKKSPSGILLEKAAMKKKPRAGEEIKKHVLFRYQAPGHKLKSVQLSGSFDKWQIRHPLVYDHGKNHWHITLQLPKGKFFYKFVVDGNLWVHSHDHPTAKDEKGTINNVLEVL